MNGNQDIDNLFKDAFSNHAVPPPPRMWEKIEQDLPLTTTDKVFKKAFTNYEVEPKPEVWTRIRRELPLSLVLRNHLNWLSRVAAVLVIGMFVYFFTQSSGILEPAENIAETNEFEENVTLQQVEQQLADNQAEQEFLFEEQEVTEEQYHEPEAQDIVVDETPVDNKPEPIADNSFINQPGNTIKGVKISQPTRKSKYDDAVAKINIDAIAESEASDNSRLSSEELFRLEQNNARFASLKEEDKTRKDSTELNKKKPIKSLESKGVKFEDLYEVTEPIASMPDFDEAEEETGAAVEIPAHLMYHSLNGQPDASMTTGKKVKRVKRRKE